MVPVRHSLPRPAPSGQDRSLGRDGTAMRLIPPRELRKRGRRLSREPAPPGRVPRRAAGRVRPRAVPSGRCRLACSGGTPRRRSGSAPYRAGHAARTRRRRGGRLSRRLGGRPEPSPDRGLSDGKGSSRSQCRCRRSPGPAGWSGSAASGPARPDRRRRRRHTLTRNRRRPGCIRREPGRWRLARVGLDQSLGEAHGLRLSPLGVRAMEVLRGRLGASMSVHPQSHLSCWA